MFVAVPVVAAVPLAVAAPAEAAVALEGNDIFVPKPVKKKKAPAKPETDANVGDVAVQRWLTVHGANLHNLQNVTAQVPLETPGRRHRRQWLRQVHPGARCAADQRAHRRAKAQHQSRPRRAGRG